MAEQTASQAVTECGDLKSYWSNRDAKFKEWYNLLLMEDKLAQTDMESFVGNDPRASYNIALHLLTPDIPHRFAATEVPEDQLAETSDIEKLIKFAWRKLDRTYKRRGKGGWLTYLTKLLLATGWFSVFNLATEDELLAEIWNPIDTYPEFGDDGIIRCAHIYGISKLSLQRKINLKAWKYNGSLADMNTTYDYWKYNEAGKVANCIIINNQFVKPWTVEDFINIPILCSPVAGLPDEGAINTKSGTDSWKAHLGESLLATNEKVYDSYNKRWTFVQQLLRDTAQPRWFVKTRSGEKIMKPEEVFKRGAVFYGSPEDSISPIPTNPLPTELRSGQLDMEAMLQRGGPPWAVYGELGRSMGAYAISQVVSSTSQYLRPFKEAIEFVLEGTDNFWLSEMQTKRLRPYGFKFPKIDEKLQMIADYDIRIPGDFINRVTAARMADPTFAMSTMRVMQELFPEIENPLREQAQARKDAAMKDPMVSTIELIQSLDRLAAMAKDENDSEGARLYSKAAESLKSKLGITVSQGAGAGTASQLAQAAAQQAPPGVRTEVAPPQPSAPGTTPELGM